MMNEYEMVLNRMKVAIQCMRESIIISYEDDDVTQGYVQGLEEALEAIEDCHDDLETAIKHHQLSELMTKKIVVSDRQMSLF